MITKVREESLTRPNMRGGKDTADYTYYIQLSVSNESSSDSRCASPDCGFTSPECGFTSPDCGKCGFTSPDCGFTSLGCEFAGELHGLGAGGAQADLRHQGAVGERLLGQLCRRQNRNNNRVSGRARRRVSRAAAYIIVRGNQGITMGFNRRYIPPRQALARYCGRDGMLARARGSC
eukprot:3796956-Pyramimonas_sp.AAC.1